MNRRRALNSVHRTIARKQGGINAAAWFNSQSFHQSAADHTTVERMSIPDLDRIGPRLVPSAREVCRDCMGAGEIIKADGNPNLPTPCEECHGRGYYEESK